FRVRAYRNAARTIDGLTRSLTEMVEEGEDLTRLSDVGEDISGYITELVQTGRLELLQKIKEEVPGTLARLLELDGVGPKTAQQLYEELDITSVEELEEALEEGEVQELEGLGEKKAEKMERSIEVYREHRQRFKLGDADQLVRPLKEYMEDAPGIQELEVTGSYRRRRETVGDIDLLAVCDDPGPLMDHFTSFEAVDRVAEAGDTRGTVILRSGLQVDIRILPERSYGAALHYFTGSKDHNVAIRKRGVEQGLRISEYGVFEVPGEKDAEEMDPEEGERIGGAREEEVYDAVGLPWIAPELREGRGEIEAAEEDRLPELLTLDDIRGDLQLHTTWSDGEEEIAAMAEACRERGYDYLAVTDHSQRVSVAQGLDEQGVEEQWEAIEEAQDRVDGIRILKGMEVDILEDGSLDLDDEHLEGLDLVLVSVHSYMDLDRSEQTDRIITAISHPAVHILGHPTGRIINEREPYEVDMEEVLQAAAEHDVALEINANPDRLDLTDTHVYRARQVGVRISIGTDAHAARELRFMSYGVDQARRGWLETGDVINTWPLDELVDRLEG
ncbi:MAG: DNA polymerase/3'-5' exonuclease PolX, partial [bacterium]